jgi:dCMP deaminase
MKTKFIKAHMRTAFEYGKLSTAIRRQVGCIIVKDNRIISIGYNGMPSGWTNECEYEIVIDHDMDAWTELKTKPEVLHAETNAIAKLARSSESGEGASLFVTDSPCLDCAKLIYQAGITEVYYSRPYHCMKGVDFLNEAGIIVSNIPENELN